MLNCLNGLKFAGKCRHPESYKKTTFIKLQCKIIWKI